MVLVLNGQKLLLTKQAPATTSHEAILKALKPWKELVDEGGQKVIGETRVKLEKFECSSRECNLGNFFTDAMVYAFVKKTPYNFNYWSNVTIALTTQGNFRVPLEKGILTYSHLVTMCPFENNFIALNLFGKHLLEVLEVGVASMNSNAYKPSSSRMLQVSGLKVTYNITNPKGERVKDVQVRCQKCEIPKFEKLSEDTIYRVVVADYLAKGSNGFGVIKENGFDLEIGPNNLEALIDFIEVNNPIVAAEEGRIKVLV
ncbi:apyrase-like [Eupeodes corollae]|uniref:apyrase-like n=1 Tax=Eupeodes corollae TaxID=290404 RepID=UPI0024922EBD|nr:apyrase-like [Eupeodes corollae]